VIILYDGGTAVARRIQHVFQPEEIGELVLFICSDVCEFMTADTVYVNGGGGWR
jgi:hypothetical protein